jgi:hypothetical protein
MNTAWLTLSKERRIEILNQATALTGLPAIAIEKDWWVTLCLKASFFLPYSKHIVFKGGTSLSKGWDLIERFSEDIDLAIDRRFFGFEGDISKTQIGKLRKQLNFPNLDFATDPFAIPTVLPQRTFLEKIFLLHEEFSQEPDKIRIDRLSRHLYDLERLMDTPHGITALQDKVLYNNIVAHREKFNPLRGLDYATHTPETIKIIPPDTVLKEYEVDYLEMTKFMIYGESLNFNDLLSRMTELQNRINNLR